MSAACNIVLAGETLRFKGPLHRHAVAALWLRIPADLRGVRLFDLDAVESIDSAGLALISLLAARCGTVEIAGSPEGFAELRAAYRLGHGLAFVRD